MEKEGVKGLKAMEKLVKQTEVPKNEQIYGGRTDKLLKCQLAKPAWYGMVDRWTGGAINTHFR